MRIPRRYRFTACVGLCALVSVAVLVSLNPVARGVFETPDRADVPLLQQTETAPIHFIPAQERAEVSADIFHPTIIIPATVTSSAVHTERIRPLSISQ